MRGAPLGFAARQGAPSRLEDEWAEVVRKHRRNTNGTTTKLDVATSAWKISYKDTISFYFTQFPENHGAKEMLRAFKLYGDAMEVVIPPKRDKWGKRFGFVRFCNVSDPRRFAIQLDNIIFGANKIHVNLPKFQRERNVTVAPPEMPRQPALRQQQQLPARQENQRVFQTWRKKVDGGGGGRKVEGQVHGGGWKKDHRQERPEVQKIVYHRKNNLAEVCYSVSEEEMQKFRKLYVGTVRTPGSTYSVHEWFSMQGFFSIKITPLGASKVLMEEMEEGIIHDLLKDYHDWLYEKFEDIRGWDPDDADVERVVWVRCHGIPVHAWKEDFFASLARNFGEFLGVDEATRTKSAMDVARIRLRSRGYDVFNAVVTANINGSLFHIKMVEEWCGPLQWIENARNNTDNKGRDDDDSEDNSNPGESPPLFTVEDEWCDSSVDGWEDEGETESETEGEGYATYEEVSVVQETIGIFEDKQLSLNEPNDCGLGNNESMGNIVGNPKGVIVETAQGQLGACDEVARVTEELTHISNTGDSGGPRGDECEDEVNCGTILVTRDFCSNGGGEKSGTLDGQEVELANPKQVGKTIKKRGPGVGKKKEKKEKSKKREKEKKNNDPQPNITVADEEIPQNNSQPSIAGVVRNPVNHFGPSSSSTASIRIVASQVESVGDSGIMMGNTRHEKEMERSKAEKLWRLAKDKLGVSAEGDDDDLYIEKIKAMEERDKVVKGRKGNTNSSR